MPRKSKAALVEIAPGCYVDPEEVAAVRKRREKIARKIRKLLPKEPYTPEQLRKTPVRWPCNFTPIQPQPVSLEEAAEDFKRLQEASNPHQF